MSLSIASLVFILYCFCQLDADQDGANLDTPDLDTGLLNIVMDSIR